MESVSEAAGTVQALCISASPLTAEAALAAVAVIGS